LCIRSIEAKQETIVEDTWIVDAIRIDHDGADQTTEFDEVVPVSAVASQAGRLDAEHGANLSSAHLRNQMLEPGTLHLAGSRTAKILVDYLHLLESKLTSVVGRSILPTLTLLVVNHLSRRSLANIHDGPSL
jgi:hypothetical protein